MLDFKVHCWLGHDFSPYIFPEAMTSYSILSESDACSHDADAADPVPEDYGGNREHPVFRILKSRRETTPKEKKKPNYASSQRSLPSVSKERFHMQQPS